MLFFSATAVTALGTFTSSPVLAAGVNDKPTIVLVHGAFADSASWDLVSSKLISDGHSVIGAANPLRGVASDGAFVSSIVKNINGPVVLVGHSYGGNVISVAADGNSNVKSLIYVAGLAPDVGESATSLSERFTGSTLGPALSPAVPLHDGGKDLYILQSNVKGASHVVMISHPDVVAEMIEDAAAVK